MYVIIYIICYIINDFFKFSILEYFNFLKEIDFIFLYIIIQIF